jgi:hypothetical protein
MNIMKNTLLKRLENIYKNLHITYENFCTIILFLRWIFYIWEEGK